MKTKTTKLKIEQYVVSLASGKVHTYLSYPLKFLTQKQKQELDNLGYTGKHKGKRISREQYLNSLNKGIFKVKLLKGDSGDFSEEILVTRVI